MSSPRRTARALLISATAMVASAGILAGLAFAGGGTAAAADPVVAGTYTVGRDLPAGEYSTREPAGTCSWRLVVGDADEMDRAPISRAVVDGRTVVRLEEGRTVALAGPCEWTGR
ncbi:hypothetical protein GCM10023201_33860 [Actinomycetospora corticicola]|uniref:Secreted protein n=1 Tax=Actinomycetospora corticicola TaxID=663602 RepID=A0A7Y9J3Y2_9PSEU|nr:hypothetical protein [Actinomycetospora corticicola]NYD34492.1 hypothetical protein [Actinomycetospora corticicola]